MSKNADLLVGGPCPDLICGICQDIFDEPIQVHCPEDHMFCDRCIKQHIETQSACPICLTTLDRNSFQLSKFAQRQISRIRIRCPHHSNGCSWQGLLSEPHPKECECAPMSCANVDKGCTETGLSRMNMSLHMDQCAFQELACPNGSSTCSNFLRKDLQKHESECRSYRCPYTSEGCTFVGNLNETNVHCESYCGRLHKSIESLTEQIKHLNEAVQHMSAGLDFQPLPPPLQQEEKSQDEEEDKAETDTPSEGMDLLHEMLNGDLLDTLHLSDGKPLDTSTPPAPNLLDLGSLDFLDSLPLENFSFDQIMSQVASPEPLEFNPSAVLPKRTSNGKKIRYSKNVQLAHSAMRMAREKTGDHRMNVNDRYVNQQKSNQLALKHAVDINKLLLNDETKAKKKKVAESLKADDTSIISSPPAISSPSHPTHTATQRRPMFILASSYLSNYSSNTSPS
ncbi:hypothetical protein BY458DRAFT_555127 [Sporodiniella umbellata]|nr:hypothetical protein BY458DRAFT_555127 [Sporodiniella umbellata]